MSGRHWSGRAALAMGAALWLAVAAGCRREPQVDLAAVRARAEASAQTARQWLKTQQAEDGSFSQEAHLPRVGLTSLAAIALLDQDLDESDPNVQRAIAFIAANRQPDGSITGLENVENYETALSAIALKRTRNTQYNDMMQKAQAYMARLQQDEGEGIAADDPRYGGIGYGRRGQPDLSNTQFALEALRETELGADAETFRRAALFVERCQNLQRVNRQPWATNDGGFIYMPGLSLANEKAADGQPRHSYGTMTYAGLLSFSYCEIPKDDPRVQAALAWLRRHYTVEENPGMGHDGLFYYYMVMAKALAAVGEKQFVDHRGVRHHWAADLVNQLARLQAPDGSWVNDKSSRWLENNKSLVTAYSMIVLDRCRPFLE